MHYVRNNDLESKICVNAENDCTDFVTQVAIYLISFFHILMSSRYGTTDLAGVSIGSSIWMPVYTGLSGILLAITPIVSQLVGAKKALDAKKAVQQG
ncbi:multidrug efflux protein [Lysinibacillus sphaericus OT4b.31]|uniref:Multidrug efflux protein n=1 Tax=Lysinibacillus sphaericus OT4b.31 TaxID=1285586 RepID=R7ZDM2_LYSSH|nr:multidrug efflux protein [Lysinibacillus sphaericus OT4b.31]